MNKKTELLTNEELIKILTVASDYYYNSSSKYLSDEKFDELELEYQKRFGKKFIGAAPPETKGTINVAHNYKNLVGTLSKCKNIDDFREWFFDCLKKIEGLSYNLKDKNYLPELLVTLKYDGNSIVIEYRNGLPIKVLTRGKDGKGLDLTHVFKDYHELEILKEECGIKYEVVMTYENFNKLMKEEKTSYANPRSIVAGKLGCDDAYSYTDYFTLIPLWLKFKDRDITRSEERTLLSNEFGTEYSDYVGDYVESILKPIGDEESVIKTLEKFYQHIQEIRSSLPFMIDGLVIEFIDPNIRKHLGMNTGFPNWATALKFPYMEKESKVTGFDFTLGDSGRITPRVWFEPVYFNGAKQNKQSLQNYARYKELNLTIGSDILVQYSNDCLTYIERMDTENNKALDKQIQHTPIHCPVCGHEAEENKTGAFIFCPNPSCPGKITGCIQNYLIKMDIKGIKENMINSLKDAGLLNSIIDLYEMDYSKIKDIDNMGEKVANNIKSAINSKIPYDYEILGSLGISNCSISTAKDICKKYKLEYLMTLDGLQMKEKLLSVDNVAEITADYIADGLYTFSKTINYLLNRKHYNYKDEIEKNKSEETMTIVFTGFRDKSLKDKLELAGHKVTGSVSKNTTVLVAKDPSGNSSSIEKARKLNIPILTPEEFKNKYNL